MTSISEFRPFILSAAVLMATAPTAAVVSASVSPYPGELPHTSLPSRGLANVPVDAENSQAASISETVFVHPSVIPEWLDASAQHIFDYGSLVDGWKGDGSLRPGNAAICEAVELLTDFALEVPGLPKPYVSADEDGSICLHWRSGAMVATLSVYGDGTYSYFATDGESEARSDSEDVTGALPAELTSLLVPDFSIS